MKKKWAIWFTVFWVVFGVLSGNLIMAAGQASPEKTVAIDPSVLWTSTSWAGNNDTKSVSLDESGDFPKFVVAEANRRHVWTYYFTIPFDPNRYPIAVMTYRAKNTNLQSVAYGLWIDDSTGPNRDNICPFGSKDFIADGKVHEVRKDLRTLKPKGDILGLGLGVNCGSNVPAEFELIGLRFESDEKSEVEPVKEDAPVTVRVVDSQGKPVEGATVAIDSERVNWARKTETDKQGMATLTPLANKVGKHMLKISKEGMATVEVGDRRSSGPLPEEITLSPAVSYGGIVNDEDGKPVESVSVSILFSDDRKPGYRTRRFMDVVTDAEGRWQTPPLPDDINRLAIRLAHPDYVSDPHYGASTTPPIEKLRDRTGVMVLRKGLQVTGVVVDKEGKPIRGAHVKQGQDRWGSEYPHTYTDEKGSFKFPNAKKGEITMTVQKKGFGPELTVIKVQKGMKPVRIVLDKGRTIRGKVVDAQGKPLAGATVVADTWRRCRTISWQTTTNAEGRFAWTEAPADDVLFDILKAGYMRVRDKSLTPSDEEYVITMVRPLRIHGKVTDAETGEPIEKFQVIPGIGWGRNQSAHWERRKLKGCSDGTYETSVSYPYPEHFLRVEAEGYLPAISRSIGSDEGDISIDFKLEKGKAIEGVILLPDGKPAGGAKAILATPSQGAYIRNTTEIHDQGSPTITTKADGKYYFPPQVDPWCIVVMHDEGYREFGEADYKKGSDIKLQPWARVEGKLLIGSKPGANERITVQYVDGPHDRNQPRIYHDIKTSTDKTGAFVLDKLPPGDAILGRYVQVGTHTWSIRQRERVNIESGKTLQVQLGGRGCPIVGRFIKPAGRDDLDFANSQASFTTKIDIERNVPKPPARPDGWESLDEATKAAWTDEYKNWRKEVEKWLESEEGKAYQKAAEKARRNRKYFDLQIKPDGTFLVEDVPAGAYDLRAYIMSENPSRPMSGRQSVLADIYHEFIVPEMPGGRSDKPLDLGTLEFKAREQIVPNVDIGRRTAAKAKREKTLINQSLPELGEFQFASLPDIDKVGRVLVCFWDMEQRPSRHCLVELAKMNDNLSKSEVTVIAVNTSAVDEKQLEAWLRKNSVKFPVGQVSGDAKKTLSTWHVRKLPWLILTDKEHIVRAEGLPLSEIDVKIKETK